MSIRSDGHLVRRSRCRPVSSPLCWRLVASSGPASLFSQSHVVTKVRSCEPLNVSPAFLIDGYWPPLYPRIEYDAELLLGRAKELGCSVVRFPSVGKWATYPSEINAAASRSGRTRPDR